MKEIIIPKVTFDILPYENVVGTLSWTIVSTKGSLPLSEETYHMYPELKGKISEDMDQNTRWKIIFNLVKNRYNSSIDQCELEEKRYKEIWEKYNDEYMKELSRYLNTNLAEDCKNIQAFIGLIPVCPRYIKERTFFMTINSSPEDILDTVAHECCHFLYFEKWKTLFPDWDWKQFNKPNLIWYLSEMAIDPILNSNGFKTLFNHEFKAYPSFYNIKINNLGLMDTIKTIYKENNIENSISKSYQYVLDNKEYIY